MSNRSSTTTVAAIVLRWAGFLLLCVAAFTSSHITGESVARKLGLQNYMYEPSLRVLLVALPPDLDLDSHFTAQQAVTRSVDVPEPVETVSPFAALVRHTTSLYCLNSLVLLLTTAAAVRCSPLLLLLTTTAWSGTLRSDNRRQSAGNNDPAHQCAARVQLCATPWRRVHTTAWLTGAGIAVNRCNAAPSWHSGSTASSPMGIARQDGAHNPQRLCCTAQERHCRRP